jgi:hypothetical protein
MQNWSNWCHYRTSSVNKVVSECLATNAPVQSIGPETYVLGHFRPFKYSMKVDAKLAELVPLSHKFAKKSRIGNFRNERTGSTPFEPKLMF